MFDFESTMLQSTEYWKNTDRKSYIALYKGMRINTKQVAYLTQGAAKRAISDYILKVAWSEVYAAYQRDWSATKADIAAYIKTGFADGSLTVVALEDLPSEPDYDKIEDAQKHVDDLQSICDRYCYKLVNLHSSVDVDDVTWSYIEFLQNKLTPSDWNLYPETEPEFIDIYSRDCWVTVKDLEDNITKVYQAKLRNDPRDGRKMWVCIYDSWNFSPSDKVIAWMYYIDNTPEPYVN